MLVVSQENPDLTTNVWVSSTRIAEYGIGVTRMTIHASNDLVAIHAATAGKKPIRLPQLQEIVPLLPPGIVYR